MSHRASNLGKRIAGSFDNLANRVSGCYSFIETGGGSHYRFLTAAPCYHNSSQQDTGSCLHLQSDEQWTAFENELLNFPPDDSITEVPHDQGYPGQAPLDGPCNRPEASPLPPSLPRNPPSVGLSSTSHLLGIPNIGSAIYADTGTDVNSTPTGTPKNLGPPIPHAPSPPIISAENSKMYLCPCGHKTKKKGDMQRHQESLKHSEKKYTCLCGKSYTRKDSLKRHEEVCKELYI